MSGSVWYLSFSKKKIEFKKYPKKKKNKKNKLKINVFSLLFYVIILFSVGFVSAEATADQLHVNIQVTYANGSIANGTYKFTFNITTDESCTNILYSNTTIIETDSRGIISYYLGNVNLNFTEQYYLCYYRNDSLINVSKMGMVPYAFRAKNVSSGGIDFDSNLNAGAYNFSTTGWFKGLFNWIIGAGSNYLSFNGTTLDFNESALNVTIDSRVNQTTGLTNYYNKTEVDANISAANTSISNWVDALFPQISELVGLVGNWTAEKLGYYNKTEVDTNISAANTSLRDYVEAYYLRNDGDNGTGVYNFNSGWQDGGVTIDAGSLYAQSLYVYNITSLAVSHLDINGSLLPQIGYNNTFDIGNSTLFWRNGYFGGNVTAGNFIGNGSLLTDVAAEEILWNANFTNVAFTNIDETFDLNLNVSGNLSVGSGQTFAEIYHNGSTNLFDTQGYSAFFTENVSADYFLGNQFLGNGSLLTDLSISPGAYPNIAFTNIDETFDLNLNVSGNLSVGNGQTFAEIYHNGSTNLFNTQGYSAFFTENVTAQWFLGKLNASDVQNPPWLLSSTANDSHAHSAENITAGTFGAGNFVFQNNLQVNQNFTVDANTLFVNSNTDRVGIGTTTPQNTLNVVGDINATASIFSQGMNVTAFNSTMKAYVDATGGASWAANYSGRTGTGNVVFNSSPTITSPTILTSITLPASQINTTHIVDGTILVSDLNTEINSTYARLNAANTFGAFNQTFDTNLLFLNNNVDRVGIGTTTPQNTLNVIGDINATGDIYANGTFVGNVTGTANNSDTVDFLHAASFARVDAANTFGDFNQTFDTNTLFVDAVSGRVGVGTTSPQAQLAVANGDINLEIWSDGGNSFIQSFNRGGSPGYDGMRFYGSEYSFNSGNVGIGATNPSYKLQVQGAAASSVDLGIITDAGNQAADYWVLKGVNSDNSFRILSGGKTWPLDDANSAVVTMTTGGNVGINTTTPVTLKSTATLQVVGNLKLGNDNAAGLISLGDIASTGANVGIWRGSGGAYGSNGNYLALGGYDGITFATGNAEVASQTERMRITSGGNVGIGITNPGANLHINSSLSSNVYITQENTTSGSSALWFGNNYSGTPNWGGMGFDTDESLKISTTGSFSNAAITITNTSNVGIGTTGPQNTLNVVGNTNVTGHCVAENSMISMEDGSKKRVTDIKSDEKVLSLDEKTGKIVSNKVKEVLDMGYKPIYELTTESGRAINTTAEHPYLVKLYSEEECKKYEGNIWNKEYDDFNGEYCERWVSVSELKENESIAVSNQTSLPKNSLSKSSVVNTGTSDCSLRCGSLDQIAELVNNASARKSISSGSDIENLAVLKNSLYLSPLKNSIEPSISFCLISNSCSESLDLDKIISLYLSNSNFMNSGAINSALIEENKYAETDLGFMSERNILLSNTNFILIYPYFILSLGDMELSNSSLISGETSESIFLNLPFLASLPSSTDHLINSCSSLECNLLNNCSACLLRSNKTVLISSDQFTQENSDMPDFNSSSTANVIDAIYISPLDFNSSSFLSSLILSDTVLRATAATFTSGNSFLNSASNSSGIDTVTLGILDNSIIYFNTSKDVQVFKSLDSDEFYFDKIISINTTAEHPYLVRLISNNAYSSLSDLNKSLVENTFILDCSLNPFSSDQIAELNAKASAKYGSSLIESCGESLLASGKNFSYSSSLTESISCFSNEYKKSNSHSSICANFINFCLSLDNSSNVNSGEINLNPLFNNSSIRYLLSEFCLKNENKILASTTNTLESMLNQSPCLLATLNFKSSESSEICLSVNLLLDNMLSATENCNLLTNCLTTLSKANLNSSLSSDGTSILTTISSINLGSNNEYLKFSDNGGWLKVIDLEEGMEIAVPDYGNNTIKWEKIASIKQHPAQHVYDLSIENTHNFIANDIVAHNTYLGDSVSDVATVSGNFSVDSPTFFVDSVSDRVGIGTTGPNFILQAAGSTGIAVRSTGVDGAYQDILTGYYSGNENEQNAIQTAVSSGADGSGFRFQVSDGGGASTQKLGYQMTRASHRFYIGGSEKVTIDSNGNVGIGTTGPKSPLQVGSTASVLLNFDGTVGGMMGHNFYYSGGWKRTSASYSDAIAFNDGATGGIALYTAASDVADSAITWGDPKVKILNNGNVGIGTTAPGAKLHVDTSTNVDVNFRIGYLGNYFDIGRNAATGGLLIQGTQGGANNILLAPTSGNVGIGTTGPGYKLDVRGATDIFIDSVGNGTINVGTYIGTPVAGLANAAYFGTISNSPLVLGVNSASKYMVMDTSGNVGIGTTGPDAKLDVYGTIRTTISDSAYYADMTYLGTTYNFGASEVADNVDFKIAGGGTFTTGGNIRFWTQAGGASPAERMRITKDGNVGIGTTNPASLLQVGTPTTGNSIYDTATRIRAIGSTAQSATDEVILRINRGENSSQFYPGTADFKLGSYGAGGAGDGYAPKTKLTIALKSTSDFNEGADVNVMTLQSNGNVGIGTTGPGANLHIKASAVASTGIKIEHTGTNGYSSELILNNTPSAGTGGEYSIGVSSSGNGDIAGNKFYIRDSDITPTASSYRFLINSDGNVGIGTTNPATGKLQVYTTTAVPIKMESNSTDATVLYMTNSDASPQSWGIGIAGSANGHNADSNFYIRDETGSSDKLTITTTGNVGIGTTGPGSKLVVNGILKAATATGLGTIGLGDNSDDTVRVGFYRSNGTMGTTGNSLSLGAYQDILFTTGNDVLSAQTPKMVILQSGNVGIGTTGPVSRLHILNGDGWEEGLSIGNAGMTEGVKIWSDNVGKDVYFDNLYNSDDGDMFFRTKLAGTSIDAMVIKGGGNVGIGTTGPENRLDFGTIASGDGIRLGQVDAGLGTTHKYIGLNDLGAAGTFSGGSWIDFTGNNDGDYGIVFQMQENGIANTQVTFQYDGNVGIGTTAPGYPLEVNPANVAGASVGTGLLGLVGQHNTVNRPYLYFKAKDAGTTFTGGMRWIDGNGNEGWAFENNRLVGSDYLEINKNGAEKIIIEPTGTVLIGYLAASVGGTAKLAINGSVGIGTTNPGAKLHVNTDGDLVAIFEDGDNPILILKDANAGTDLKYAGLRLNGNLLGLGKMPDSLASFTDIMSINTNTGNVGIGTTGPGAKLDVSHTSPADWTYAGLAGYYSLVLGRSDGSGVGSIKLNSYSSGQYVFMRPSNGNFHLDSTTGQYFLNWDSAITADDGAIHIGDNAGSEDIRFDTGGDSWFNGGNVGIGTTNPASLLQVGTPTTGNSIYDTATRIRAIGSTAQSATDEVILRINRGENSGQFYPGTADFKLGSYGAGGAGDGYAPKTKLTIALKSTSDFNEGADVNVMTLQSNGNVGIGTTGPGSKLVVNGILKAATATGLGTIGLGDNSDDTVRVGFYRSNGTMGTTGNSLSLGAYQDILFTTGNDVLSAQTPKMVILQSGNVGIGTLSIGSGAKLHVAGQVTTGDVINLGQLGSVSTSAYRGITWEGSFTDTSYAIFKPAGAWTQPLHVAFYTGIKIGADTAYGGTKFYSSSNMGTELMSIGNGDNHVRIANNLYASAVVTGATTLNGRLYMNSGTNLHLDSYSTGTTYINYYAGTGGVNFCNGANGCSASVSAGGVFSGSGTGLTGVLLKAGSSVDAAGYVGLNGGTTYGIGVSSSNRNSGVFDTVETTGSDPLQLVYYSTGAGVTVGDSGADHPLTVYGTATATNFIGPGTGLTGTAASLNIGGSAGSVPWSGVSSKPTTLSGYGITDITSQEGSRYTTDFNTITETGFFNAEGTPANSPGGSYGQLISARGIDTGMQIYGGYGNDNLWFRGWANSGGIWYTWRQVIHSGNIGSQSVGTANYWDGYDTPSGWDLDASNDITTSNIGSQSVSYATTAGSAGTASTAYALAGAASPIYGSTGTSYGSAVQVREANLGGAQGGGAPHNAYQPRLGFHWSGVVASSITMENSGRIAIVNNPGTGYENLIANYIYGAAFYYTSDEVLKKNITKILGALDKVKLLQGVNFQWKADNRSSIGFIAQDVEKVLPELVGTDNSTGLKSVQYGNVVALTVEAIKEQQNQIENLSFGWGNLSIGMNRFGVGIGNLTTRVDNISTSIDILMKENVGLKLRLEKIEMKMNEIEINGAENLTA